LAAIAKLKAALEAAEAEWTAKSNGAHREAYDIALEADQINQDAAKVGRHDLFVQHLPYAPSGHVQDWGKELERANRYPFSYRDSDWFSRLSAEEKEKVIAEHEPSGRPSELAMSALAH
jgi:hypothetical protein